MNDIYREREVNMACKRAGQLVVGNVVSSEWCECNPRTGQEYFIGSFVAHLI